MSKIKIIQREEVRDAEGHPGTLYLVEKILGIRKAILKNGSFMPENVGKSLTQSFDGGCIEESERMFERLKDEVSEGSIYETMERMNRGTFDSVYFPH